MKKGYTHIAVVLDRSGSMDYIKSDTIGGFNAFLKEQKEQEGSATFTLAQFDSQYELVYNGVSIKEVRELTNESFSPRGSTALFDAICRTIDSVGRELHSLRETEKPEKVVFVVITDGQENDSKEFTLEDVKSKIAHQTNNYSWEFVFLAANQDAMETARTYNINPTNAINWVSTPKSVNAVFLGMSKNLTNYRADNVVGMSYTSVDREEQEEANK